MAGMNSIDSLRRSLEKVNDSGLRNEMLGKVAEVHDHLRATSEQLHAKQGEVEQLRAQLSGNPTAAQPATDFYDPPV